MAAPTTLRPPRAFRLRRSTPRASQGACCVDSVVGTSLATGTCSRSRWRWRLVTRPESLARWRGSRSSIGSAGTCLQLARACSKRSSLRQPAAIRAPWRRYTWSSSRSSSRLTIFPGRWSTGGERSVQVRSSRSDSAAWRSSGARSPKPANGPRPKTLGPWWRTSLRRTTTWYTPGTPWRIWLPCAVTRPLSSSEPRAATRSGGKAGNVRRLQRSCTIAACRTGLSVVCARPTSGWRARSTLPSSTASTGRCSQPRRPESPWSARSRFRPPRPPCIPPRSYGSDFVR